MRDARSTSTAASPGHWLKWLLIGWLAAGTFDITYATGFSYWRTGVAPARVLRYVASGLLGPDAAQGGTPAAILGLTLHYLIAFIFTIAFFAVARRLPWLARHAVAVGAVYGLGIYVVMNSVVLPLSHVPARAVAAPAIVTVTGVLVHMFLIGVPIALAARAATRGD